MLFPDQVPSLVDSHFSCSFLVSWASTSRTIAAVWWVILQNPMLVACLFKFPESVNTSFPLLSLYGYFLKLPLWAEVPCRSELSSGQDWVAHCHPLLTHIFFGIFPACLPLQARVGKLWPDLFCLGWFDNPEGQRVHGLSFRGSYFLSITTGCPPVPTTMLASISAGGAVELLKELPAEGLVSQVRVS